MFGSVFDVNKYWDRNVEKDQINCCSKIHSMDARVNQKILLMCARMMMMMMMCHVIS